MKDLLVKVGKFVFRDDFTVFDMELDHDVLVILGRQFLAVGGALINVAAGNLILRLNDEYFTFNIYEIMKYPKYFFSFPCFQVNLFKELIREFLFKGIDDKFMEHNLVDDESDIKIDIEADHSELEDP